MQWEYMIKHFDCLIVLHVCRDSRIPHLWKQLRSFFFFLLLLLMTWWVGLKWYGEWYFACSKGNTISVLDRKSTRLNSSHPSISYAVFCLKKKTSNKARIYIFIKSILKSLVILAMWLALSGAIYSRIAPSFALNRVFFSANENGTVKQSNQSDFKAFLN